MKERETKEDLTIPPNMTIAWGTSTVSFCESTYRNWVKEGNRYSNVHLLGIMRDEGQVPEEAIKELFMKTLSSARNNLSGLYHFVRLDNEQYVQQDSNNEPFSQKNGWCKKMNLWGYEYTSQIGG